MNSNILTQQSNTQCKINIYEKNNPVYFKSLKQIVEKYPCHAKRIIQNHYIEINNWIYCNTPLIQPHKNDFNQRIEWILNGRQDFPKCKVCNKKITDIKRFSGSILKGYYDTCSKYCMNILKQKRIKEFIQSDSLFFEKRTNKSKQTCLKKYGVENAYQSSTIKQKIKQTKLERYNNENFVNVDKIKQTKLKKYGNAYFCNIEKCKQTCLKKYGVQCSLSSKYVRAKYEQTMKQKYSVSNPGQSSKIQTKIKQTSINKYGKNHYLQADIVKEKIKQTNLKKYGCENPMQNRDIRIKAQQRYSYDGLHFDSSPELAYYIWLKDANVSFEYQPNISFQYEFNGKTHVYMPDFKVNDEYIELKGDHFLKEDGTWQNPWDHSQDALYEAKHQCLLKNNVKILMEKDYNVYVDYVDTKYGKDYLKQFK